MTNLSLQNVDIGRFGLHFGRPDNLEQPDKRRACQRARFCNETEANRTDAACTGALGFRERQAECLHKEGATAFGFFQVYKPLHAYTSARFLQDPSQKVPVFVHFVRSVPRLSDSALTSVTPANFANWAQWAHGSSFDSGFAVRFYTEHGIFDWLDSSVAWDMADDSNRSSSKRAQLIQGQEILAMLNDQRQDRPQYGSSVLETKQNGQTYRLIDSTGNVRVARLWWKFVGFSRGGSSQADKLVQSTGDMCLAVDAGLSPQYELYMQILHELDASNSFSANVTNESQAIAIGKMVLDRGVQNLIDDADDHSEMMPLQISNLVPGIEATRQAVLQHRFFSAIKQRLHRADKMRPSNKLAKTWNLQDSAERSFLGSTGASSLTSRKPSGSGASRPLLAAHNLGIFAGCLPDEKFTKDVTLSYAQSPRELYQALSPADREELIGASLCALMNIEEAALREQILAQCCEIDIQLAHALATGLGLEFPPAKQFHILAAHGSGSRTPSKTFALTTRRS